MSESKTSTRKIEAQERERQAVELRKAGASYDAIAQRLGYKDRSAAYNAVRRALEKLNAETAEDAAEVRRMELERLDALLLALWGQAKQGNQGAVDRVLRVMERRAKLLGLDAPTRVDTYTDGQMEIIVRWANDLTVSGEPTIEVELDDDSGPVLAA